MKTITLVISILLLGAPALAGPKAKGKRPRPRPAPAEPRPVDDPEADPFENEPELPPPPAAKPAPANPPPRPTPPPPAPEIIKAQVDLDGLRAEYDALRDALFKSRARAQAVEDATSTTKLSLRFQWETPKGFVARRAQIRLDDAPLWDSGDASVSGDPVTLAERGVPPGKHALSIRLDVRAKNDDRMGWTSAQTFGLDLPADKRTEVEITVDEDGDLPEYEPEIEVEVRSKK